MKVGSLEIDFVTNVARLQSELSDIRRAVGQTMGEAVAQTTKLIKSTASLTEQLEREADTFGKTAQEIRQATVATKLLELEQRGLTVEAERLSAANQRLIQVQGTATRGSGAMRSGMQQLSFQMNDVATSFQGGVAPMTIFAQQGSQVIQAVQLMAGESKGFIGFLGGPWGAILTAATVVLAPLVMKLWEGSSAADKETASLQTLAGATTALDAATGRANKTQQESIELAVEATKRNLDLAISQRKVLAARLEGFSAVGSSEGGAMAAAFGLVTERQIAANENAIADAQRALKGADFAGIVRQVGAETDKTTAATQRYEAEVSRLKTAVVDHNMSQAEAHRQLLAAQRALDAVKDADKNAAAAKRDHNKEVRDAAKAHREAAKAAKDAAKIEIDAEREVYQVQQSLRDTVARGGGLVATGDVYAGLNKLPEAADILSDELERQKDLWDQIIDRVDEAANSMSDAFGRVGGSIGDAMHILASYGKQQDQIAEQARVEGWSQAKLTKANADLQLSGLIGLTSAAKGLFKEHSAGYKAMAAAEKALTIIQVARTAVDVAGGAARMFSTLGPLAFPAVAAMLGVMASLGFGGGGSAGSAPTSNAGTGTVFGDSGAKSESIQRALDELGDIDTQHLHYAAQMAASLKSIEGRIGNLASLIVRTPNVNADAGVATGFQTNTYGKVASSIIDPFGIASAIPIVGDVVGAIKTAIKSLFGTKTSIVGNGLFGGAQSLGDILGGGIDLSNYTDIEKKKKFLGVTTGKSYSTQYTDADSDIERQFGLILTGFYQTIAAAANPLGLATSEIEGRLNSFVVDLGRIDLKGLTGDQINAKLTAVFGAAADNIARAAYPGLEAFQKVGEGYFETLARVASTVEAVTVSLDELGLSSHSLGIEASMAIAGMFDSVADYQSAAGAYFQSFYTQAEQAAKRTEQMSAAFATFGLVLPDSIAAYRSLVEAQDLTTDAGQQAYAMLLKLAPAFADLQQAGEGAAGGLASAAEIARQRADLERQLLELSGDANAIRADDRRKIAEQNLALFDLVMARRDEIKAAQDAAAAADELARANEAAAAAAAQRAAAIASEQTGLAMQLLEAQGNTAEIRRRKLADLLSDEARQTQQQIWDIEDRTAAQAVAAQQAAEAERVRQQAADEAARAAQQLADVWRSISQDLLDEVKRIRGMSSTGALSFAQLQGQFNAATIAARAGDQDAGKSLAGLSRDLLDVAAQVATSEQELRRVQASTATSLEDTARLVGMAIGGSAAMGFGAIANDNSAAPAWPVATSGGGSTSASLVEMLSAKVDALTAELQGLRSDNNDGNSTLSSKLGSIDNTLKRAVGPDYALRVSFDEPVTVKVAA